MKTTLDLPDDIVLEMKLRALVQGRTMRDLAADFLRQGLGLVAPKHVTTMPPDSPIQINEKGFPIFRSGNNAPAQHMRIEQLLQLEQDALTSEDMQRAGISV
jgi:hypothetical protein